MTARRCELEIKKSSLSSATVHSHETVVQRSFCERERLSHTFYSDTDLFVFECKLRTEAEVQVRRRRCRQRLTDCRNCLVYKPEGRTNTAKTSTDGTNEMK